MDTSKVDINFPQPTGHSSKLPSTTPNSIVRIFKKCSNKIDMKRSGAVKNPRFKIKICHARRVRIQRVSVLIRPPQATTVASTSNPFKIHVSSTPVNHTVNSKKSIEVGKFLSPNVKESPKTENTLKTDTMARSNPASTSGASQKVEVCPNMSRSIDSGVPPRKMKNTLETATMPMSNLSSTAGGSQKGIIYPNANLPCTSRDSHLGQTNHVEEDAEDSATENIPVPRANNLPKDKKYRVLKKSTTTNTASANAPNCKVNRNSDKRNSVKRANKRQSQNKGEPPYLCRCGAIFMSWKLFWSHCQTHYKSRNKPPKQEKVNYSCGNCKAVFNLPEYFRKHKAFSEKNYDFELNLICPCGKKLANKPSFESDSALHDSKNYVNCHICKQEVFKEKFNTHLSCH